MKMSHPFLHFSLQILLLSALRKKSVADLFRKEKTMRNFKFFSGLVALVSLMALFGCGGKEEPLEVPADQAPKGAARMGVGATPASGGAGGGGATQKQTTTPDSQ